MTMGLRWAVSLRACESSGSFEALFRRALLCLPQEDAAKQARFHFRDDSLACVVGRLLIRACVVHLTSLTWHQVETGRSERGKPFLLHGQKLHFNVSHQGDMVVLATSRRREIGVDVMRIDEERGSTALEHISRMEKLFTADELAMMRRQDTERKRWAAFYRVWCLKEAVLKATGTGLTNDLRTLGFNLAEEQKHEPGCFITSTGWSERGIVQPNWLFEESFIGEDHCVAVGKIYDSASAASSARDVITAAGHHFEMISMEHLLEKATPINEEEGTDDYQIFQEKPWKDE